jgi:predicted aspartyl protease
MNFRGSLRAFCLALLWIVTAGAAPGPVASTAVLWNFYRQADFFALRSALPVPSTGDSEDIAFLRAAMLSASAQPAASSRLLEQLLQRPVTNSALDVQARELLMLNRRAMFRYREALVAVAPLLRGTQQQSERVRSIENRAHLLRAIADVGPQTVTGGNQTVLLPDARGRIAVSIGHQVVRMFADTGANLSVMPRHVARALGLTIRPANYSVGSSVGGRVTGDVAVADLAFGDGTRIRNAIFLVLPDNAVPVALLGYPVISALGSIVYSDGGIVFGSQARAASSTSLALSGNDLLLRARYAGQDILCRLDSGSARSVFYAPFYRRFGGRLSVSTQKSLRVGGATGTYKFGARQVSSLTIVVAGRPFRLSPATILTEPVRDVPNGALACNIGRDVLLSARDYRIDFANMTLSFGP